MTRKLTTESVLQPPKSAPSAPAVVSLDAHPSDSLLVAVSYDTVNTSSVHIPSARPPPPSIDGSRLNVVNAQDSTQSSRLSVSSGVRSGVTLYSDSDDRDDNGCVAVWTRERPLSPLELLSFRGSRVSPILWVPDDPNLLLGGTRNGHVAVWDLRVGGDPCQVGPEKAAWRAADGRRVTSLAAGGGGSRGEAGGGGGGGDGVGAGGAGERGGEEVLSGSAGGRLMRWSRRMMGMPLEVIPLTPPGVSPDSWRMLTQWPLVPSELQMGTTPVWRGAPGNAPEEAPGGAPGFSPGISPGVFYMGSDCGGVFQGHLSPSALTASASTPSFSSSSSSASQSRLDIQFGSCAPGAPATSAATSSAVSASASGYGYAAPSQSGLPAKQEPEPVSSSFSCFSAFSHPPLVSLILVSLIPVSLIPVSLIPVSLIPVSLILVSLIPVSLILVSLIPVSLILVSLIPVSLILVSLIPVSLILVSLIPVSLILVSLIPVSLILVSLIPVSLILVSSQHPRLQLALKLACSPNVLHIFPPLPPMHGPPLLPCTALPSSHARPSPPPMHGPPLLPCTALPSSHAPPSPPPMHGPPLLPCTALPSSHARPSPPPMHGPPLLPCTALPTSHAPPSSPPPTLHSTVHPMRTPLALPTPLLPIPKPPITAPH
ncbi:unnamed protein product [Closterium sp. Naga37s-1]|nr:unnamed protein product [Closterium sp. Naga37s-1]